MRASSTVAALALVAISGTASAASLDRLGACALVPAASFDAERDTAVGLISQSDGTIHWNFFDQGGLRADSGSLAVADGEFVGFGMRSNLDAALSGTQGLLLFCIDSDNDGRVDGDDEPDLTANAFAILPPNDVAYLPVITLDQEDLNGEDTEGPVSEWEDDPVNQFGDIGAGPGDILYLRYFTDGVVNSGDKTTLYLFTTRSPDDTEDMRVVGPNGTVTAPVPLPEVRLNVIDVETLAEFARPTDANELDLNGSGYITWDIPDDIRGAFGFSIVESPAFGAVQTLVGRTEKDD